MLEKLPRASWWSRVLDWFLWRKPKAQAERVEPSLTIPEAPIPEPIPVKQPEVVELPPPPEPVREPEPEPDKVTVQDVKDDPVAALDRAAGAAEQEKPKRKYDSRFIHLRRELANKVELVLDVMSNITAVEDFDYMMQRSLENLYGCDFLLWDPDLFEKLQGADKWSVLEPAGLEDEMAEATWPIDFALAIIRMKDDEHPRWKNHIELLRVATINPREVRGQIMRVLPKMVRIDRALIDGAGGWSSTCDYAGLAGKQWVLIDENMGYRTVSKRYRKWLQVALPRIMSTAFSARYEWHVALGAVPNGPRLLLPTNPSDCLTLFKNRDLPAGMNRRQALRHWVEQHYAERADSGLAFIHHHLRGHTLFSWCGFDCELFVSAFDLEKNELFKAEAKAWRAQRKHNRVRVRFKK